MDGDLKKQYEFNNSAEKQTLTLIIHETTHKIKGERKWLQ